MSLLVVGSMALDSIETPFGKGEDILGGSATYFSTSASFFTDVSLVAVVGQDFPAEALDFLRSRGVDLSGLSSHSGRTFRWKGRYGYDLADPDTLGTELGVFESFRPELSETHRDADYVFLANIDPDLQREVLDQVRSPKLVACDTMNFWISRKPEALKKTLARVDLVIINDSEVRQLSGEHNIIRAARKVLELGPQRLIVKRGEYGALMFEGDHVFAAPAWPLTDVLDPTGAGDTFAGGLMGFLAGSGKTSADVMRQAMAAASVMASFTVEGFSLDRLRSLGIDEVAARLKAFRALTHFDEIPDGVLRTVA